MSELARQPFPSEQESSPVVAAVSPEEARYQRVREAFLAPDASSNGGLLLLGTLVLFTLSMVGNWSLGEMALLLPVLLFHEMGHWMGMRLFGFRDVKMFFIPFFGAAVSGRRQGVASWKEALVLLLGPLPGILLGCVLAAVSLVRESPVLGQAALLLLTLNGFNLLPLVPLDGGKLFQLLVFSRHRYLENAFTLLTSLSMLAVAVTLQAWVLGVVGFLNVVGVARQAHLLRAVHALRQSHPHLDPVPERLDDDSIRALHAASLDEPLPPAENETVQSRARRMKQLHERLGQRPPSFLASVGLASLWFVGMTALLVGLVLLVGASRA